MLDAPRAQDPLSGSAVTTDRIVQGDCVAGLKALPADIADMVFADPPYNLQLRAELRRPNDTVVDGVNDDWDSFADFAAYDAFTLEWLTEARRVLKPDGTLWVIGSYHNIYRLGAILQDLGFWILNDVIWRKTNPMPNFRGRRFTNAHETLIWAGRSKQSRYTFNYAAMKALNDDLQMRSDWTLPLCTGPERLKGADGTKLHPTQKPEALLHRAILASTQVGDLVVDPFFGTGTTGAVAKRLDRRYIGLERDPAYCAEARARIAKVRRAEALALEITPSKRDQTRVPFGALVEQGLVQPGETVFDARRRFAARVRADGTLVATKDTGPGAKVGAKGSIHQVAAELLRLPACNGWAFWHVERKGSAIPIDRLRDDIRQAFREHGASTLSAAEQMAASLGS
jgi:modification methylase